MICQHCQGTGEIDTGGSTPWGAWITDACPYCEGKGKMVKPTNFEQDNREWNRKVREESTADESREAWVLTFYGPRLCVHLKDFHDAKKVLVESSGVPELVEAANVFTSKSECYRVAVAKKTQEGMAILSIAQKWLAECDGKVPAQ